MSIGLDEVLHVAKLAELAVKESEFRRLVEQMNRIVNYVAMLDEVPAGPDRRAVSGWTASRSRLREDVEGAVPLARPPSAMAPEFGRGVFPGAAARRDGGSVTATAGERGSGAVTARETGKRLADAAPLNAMLHWSQELLDAEGARVDAMPAAGPLAAVPVALKDNIVTVEQPTTCGSRILEGYVSPYNATVVERLRAAGALIVAQDQPRRVRHGVVHRALRVWPGQTSAGPEPGARADRRGGSAALVAAGVVPAALGSETGGSVRQPASFCGVVGVKPSYGRVSRYGLVAFGSSLDCISVFGRTVNDAAGCCSAISGPDPLDATTVDRPPDAGAEAARPTCGASPWVCRREYFPADLDSGVRAALRRTIDRDRGSWARRFGRCRCRNSTYAVPTYYIIAPAEAAANLARYDGVRYGLRRVGPEGDIRALYRATRGEGLRRGGPPPDSGGHLRAERGLLRRLLQEGPAGAGPDRARTSAGPSRRAWTCSSRPRLRRRRSRPGKRPKIRSRCTWPTSLSAR